jgi:hypothetical protein
VNDKTGNVKLGAAVLGGYVLGRTKKLKTGVRLAMWLAGDTGGPLPKVIGAGRSGINSLAGSEEVKALGEQVRGPLAEALQKAAMASLTSRLDRLTTGIQNRTDKLNSTVEGTAGAVTDTAGKTAGKVLGKLDGKKDTQDAPEQDSGDQSQQQHQEEQPELQDQGGEQQEHSQEHQDA